MNGKSISAAVGQGGANIPVDVATVQYLLNCVPASHGGPGEELVIDGFAGVLTNGAITRFQNFQLGWADGRVDPEQRGGKTIVKLKGYDPLPFSAPSFKPGAPSSGGKGNGKKQTGTGKKQSGGRPVGSSEIADPGWIDLPGYRHSGKSAGKRQSK